MWSIGIIYCHFSFKLIVSTFKYGGYKGCAHVNTDGHYCERKALQGFCFLSDEKPFSLPRNPRCVVRAKNKGFRPLSLKEKEGRKEGLWGFSIGPKIWEANDEENVIK